MAKILILEDDEVFQALESQALRYDGHTVLIEKNGDHVLEIINKESPDLIITDIVMDGKEGLEVTREVSDKYPLIPIIAVSGADETYLEMAKDFGAVATFTKPINQNSFCEFINNYLP